VAVTAVVLSWDDRLYQNMFLGGTEPDGGKIQRGTAGYDGCPDSIKEYIRRNAYLNNNPANEWVTDAWISTGNPNIRIHEKDKRIYMELEAEKKLRSLWNKAIRNADGGTL